LWDEQAHTHEAQDDELEGQQPGAEGSSGSLTMWLAGPADAMAGTGLQHAELGAAVLNRFTPMDTPVMQAVA
jgi:hypothetical protein